MIPVFLRVEDVLEIHRDQIARYGGAVGVRDLGLLESAIAQPSATFDEEFLHRDIIEMAAAYLYHVTEDRLVNVVLGVACGELQKPYLVQFLRSASEDFPEQS